MELIRLMKNEIIKLLKKKSFYIVTLIFILFCILTNIVYQTSMDYVSIEEVDIEELIAMNEELDLTQDEDLLIYVENLTTIKMEELKKTYRSSVQEYLVDHFLYTPIYRFYESMYILEDEELTQLYQNNLDEYIEYVKDNNWEYFLDERIQYLEERVNNTQGVEQMRYQELLDLAFYRKENNVPYDDGNYLHRSLDFLEENMVEYVNLLHDDYLTQDEEERLSFLSEKMSLHEYVITHKQDILNETNLRAVLANFPAEFGIFILIYVIMLAGSIVSEEYARGTIKSLLVKPFKRRTILTSKLLVVLLLIPFIMIFMSVIELVIGGIILGFDSLSVPIVLYQDGVLLSYSPLGYLARLLISSLGIYYVLGIFAFFISTVTLSTSAAITISFLFYLLLNVVSNLALVYPLPVFNCFVSLYWDFSYLVSHQAQPYGASLFTSLLVIFAYLFVMLCITYVTFMKKDVKNI